MTSVDRYPHAIDIPGPVDWEHASHWIKYDTVAFTVETWCKTGPDYQYHLQTRVRPMCESEVIHAKLEGHSREAVLRCYGVEERPFPTVLPKQRRWWQAITDFFG